MPRSTPDAPLRAGSPILVLKMISLSAAMLTLLIAAQIARTLPADRQGWLDGLALVAWNPLFAWEVLGQLHNDGLILVGMTVFLAAALRGRLVPASIALALTVTPAT